MMKKKKKKRRRSRRRKCGLALKKVHIIKSQRHGTSRVAIRNLCRFWPKIAIIDNVLILEKIRREVSHFGKSLSRSYETS